MSVPVVTPAAPPSPAKKRRGREGATDMIRSLGVVMTLVVGLWFFGQASPSDEQRIRPVDPTLQYTDFAKGHPGIPLPSVTPQGWTPNVAVYDPVAVVLRVGYVISADAYTEFAAGSGPGFVADQSAHGEPVGTVDVAGVTWQHLRGTDGTESLVRVVQGVSLVVGGVREKASLPQLETLAASVR